MMDRSASALVARLATPNDQAVIRELTGRAKRALPQRWWWEEYLSANTFVVTEARGQVIGALLAWADDSPVAWVRLAALADGWDAGEWLDVSLPPIVDGLRRQQLASLAWMDYGGWAGRHLAQRGFEVHTEVLTLEKEDQRLPRSGVPRATLHPARLTDLPALVALERAAFVPHWWTSQATLRRVTRDAAYFAVAQREGSIVGYAAGVVRGEHAHLNRLTVHPAHQGRGIGGMLLADALRAFWQQGAARVSLNTQADNVRSLRLYRRFGFHPTGDRVTVWELSL